MSKQISMTVLFVVVFFVVGATQVGPNRVFDEFKKIEFKQFGNTGDDPYWWIINNGDQGQHYDGCSDAACVLAEKGPGGNTNEKEKFYARLQLLPDQTPGFYTGAEISEVKTGYTYGQPAKWLPTLDNPVTATARVRFSDNYHQDGSGGAVGTAGFWLWNSPADFFNQEFHPATSIGFIWLEDEAIIGDGLRIVVLQDDIYLHNEPVTLSLDMTQWIQWDMIWSVDENDQQTVQFFVNDELVSQSTSSTPLPALSITLWNDNQYPTFSNGEFVIEDHPASETQNFDVAYVEVSR